MTDDSHPVSLSPFPRGYRASGLLHVTSLPSAYGVGDVGPTAIRWISTNNLINHYRQLKEAL
jgi:4-alpha-glucanotransferase